MILTQGAMFTAHIYHNVYQKLQEENQGYPVEDWDRLSRHERMVRGTAFQALFDLDVMKPFTLVEARTLIAAGIIDEPHERVW